jgi:hypothetical protein
MVQLVRHLALPLESLLVFLAILLDARLVLSHAGLEVLLLALPLLLKPGLAVVALLLDPGLILGHALLMLLCFALTLKTLASLVLSHAGLLGLLGTQHLHLLPMGQVHFGDPARFVPLEEVRIGGVLRGNPLLGEILLLGGVLERIHPSTAAVVVSAAATPMLDRRNRDE